MKYRPGTAVVGARRLGPAFFKKFGIEMQYIALPWFREFSAWFGVISALTASAAAPIA
jgi:hypothetical protein